MLAGTVWKQLVATLENDTGLRKYIKAVFEGRRFDIEPESLPCIMLEPTQNNEVEKDFNQTKNIYLNVDLFAFSSANFTDFEKTIVGDLNYKGILDIENDIRACLQSSYTLADNVMDVRFEPTVFDQLSVEGEKYPVRGLMMPLRILYRQTNGV